MRRPGIILVLAAILLALGLVAPRVARHWRTEARSRDTSTTGPGLRGGADRANPEASAREPSLRELWRRSRGTGTAQPENSPEREGPASGEPRLSWIDQLIGTNGATPLSPEAIERWLEAGHTNAADLLALRQAGAGIKYLEAAIRRFPDDPRVLLASTSLRESTEVVRERMDRFRQADPQNALADYLSAWNELAAGNREKAIEHLAAAGTKSAFRDYTTESARAAEELYRFEGRSEAEAVALGSSGVHLPHLTNLKSLANGLADLQKELVATGDSAGAEQLARSGLQLGKQLTTGPGSTTLIGELVGMAIERLSVRELPPDAAYDFLGGNPDAFRQDLDRRRSEIRSVGDRFETWIRGASEADVIAYFDVLHKQGERTALEWLRDRIAAKAP